MLAGRFIVGGLLLGALIGAVIGGLTFEPDYILGRAANMVGGAFVGALIGLLVGVLVGVVWSERRDGYS